MTDHERHPEDIFTDHQSACPDRHAAPAAPAAEGDGAPPEVVRKIESVAGMALMVVAVAFLIAAALPGALGLVLAALLPAGAAYAYYDSAARPPQ